MSFMAYFSEGTGLVTAASGLCLILAGVGITIYRSKKKQFLGEILLPCTLIAISILFFAISFSFPVEEAGSSAVPRLWIFWLCVLSGGILWQVFKGEEKKEKEKGKFGFLLLVAVILIAYYFAMQTLGYFISSFLFLIILMQVLSFKRWLIILSVSGGWVLFSYVVFYKVLYIQLPLGYFEAYF